MPAEIADQRRDRSVVDIVAGGERPLDSHSPRPPAAPGPPRPEHRSRRWYSGLGMASIRARSASPPGRSNMARSRRPYFSVIGVPTGRREHGLDPRRRDVRHDPVEALAVEVHHPQHLAELRHHRIDQRLPDRALVELGVAHQRDVTTRPRHLEVAADVAVGQRAPDRGGGPDADRAGREVHRVRVLGAARVALQPVEGPELGQVGRVQPAHQVVDGVQHRRGMRLHRHPILRPQTTRSTAPS